MPDVLYEKYGGFPKLRKGVVIEVVSITGFDANSDENPSYHGHIHLPGSKGGLIDWNAARSTDKDSIHRIKGKEYCIEVWPEDDNRDGFAENQYNNKMIKRVIAETILEFDEDIPPYRESG